MHASILADLAATLRDPDFIAAHRVGPKDFSRQRVLTFPVLVAFLPCAFKGAVQPLLDELLKSLTDHPERVVTKSAVSQSRRKLKASAFEALNERLLTFLDMFWPEPRWGGGAWWPLMPRPCACPTGRKTRPNSGSRSVPPANPS